MNADDLKSLARACETSMADGDAWVRRRFGAQLKDGHVLVVSGGTIDGIAIPSQSDPVVGVQRRLGQLLAGAGLADAVRMELEMASGPLLNSQVAEMRFPAPLMEQMDKEDAASGPYPDIERRMAACLLLLNPNRVVAPMPWFKPLVQAAIHVMLLEHPALMHPRLVYQFFNERDLDGIVGSLPHALLSLDVPLPVLPDSANEESQDVVRAFARHPVIVAALTERSVKFEDRDNAPNPFIGKSVVETLFFQARRSAVAFTTSLLRLHRVSTAAGGPPLLPSAASPDDRARLVTHLARKHTEAWVTRPSPACLEFLRELSLCPIKEESSFKQQVLLGASRVFVDLSGMKPEAAHCTPGLPMAQDPQERLARFVEAAERIQASWGRTRAEIADLAVRALFPTVDDLGLEVVAKQGMEINYAPANVEAEAAVALVHQLLEMGVDRAALMTRLGCSPSAGEGWRHARHMLETHRTMQEVISRVTASAEDATPPARPARRRAL